MQQCPGYFPPGVAQRRRLWIGSERVVGVKEGGGKRFSSPTSLFARQPEVAIRKIGTPTGQFDRP